MTDTTERRGPRPACGTCAKWMPTYSAINGSCPERGRRHRDATSDPCYEERTENTHARPPWWPTRYRDSHGIIGLRDIAEHNYNLGLDAAWFAVKDRLKPEGECTWTEDEDGNWNTGCGNMFVFINDTPGGNGCKYCCYCGHKLDAVRYTE